MAGLDPSPSDWFTDHIPPVWQDDVELWFIRIECQFKLANVTSEEEKYMYMVANLDKETLARVSDIIIRENQYSEKYTALKNAMIERLSPSPDERRAKLFSGLKLGDKIPGQLLRNMIRLSKDLNIGNETIKFLWLRQLPINVRMFLVKDEGNTLQELGKSADELFRAFRSLDDDDDEVSDMSPAAIKILGTSPYERMEKLFSGCLELGDRKPSILLYEMIGLTEGLDIHDDTIKYLWSRQLPTNVQAILAAKEGTLNELAKTADKVFEIYKTDDSNQHFSRYDNNFNIKDKSQNNDKSNNQGFSKNYCYYHYNYGNSARKCTSPCSFQRNM